MYQKYTKSVVDFIFSLFLITVLSLPMLITALLIKLSSKGPVFFIQKRCGKNFDYFNILKFRTMSLDRKAEEKGFEPGISSRITSLGKILRKSKMDELPQLINVLKGEMSLVGPRPEVKKYIDIYENKWKDILSVKPGITDPASIKFRDEEKILSESDDPEKTYIEEIMPLKMKLYEEYLANISFLKDIKILILTFSVIFH